MAFGRAVHLAAAPAAATASRTYLRLATPRSPRQARCGRAIFGILSAIGRLAQLGERLPYKQEVGGSIPSPPISRIDPRMVLGGIFQYAREQFRFRVNPVRDVAAPKAADGDELDFYSVEESTRARPQCRLRARHGAIFLTAALAGLRRGELVALRVRNVDFDGATIRVQGSYSHGELTMPKSGKPRPVPMAAEVAKALATLLSARGNPGPEELMFPGPDGSYLDASALRRHFVKGRDDAGLRPLRFHDLRHVFGSLAIRKADIVQVQTWMGHANVNTTRRYLHHKARKDDAKILDNAFALDSPPSENGDDPDDDVVTRLQRQVAEMAETLAGMRAGT